MRILGKEWKLEFADLSRGFDGTKLFGLMESGPRRISISEEADIERRTSTLLHEIIEAINNELELNMPHPVINALETGLFQAITENPDVLGYLCAAALKEDK